MYGIRFVDDEAMPDGHDFIVVQSGADQLVLYRATAVTPAVLEDSWDAVRALGATPPPEFRLRSAS